MSISIIMMPITLYALDAGPERLDNDSFDARDAWRRTFFCMWLVWLVRTTPHQFICV